jgi:hypothetical protein
MSSHEVNSTSGYSTKFYNKALEKVDSTLNNLFYFRDAGYAKLPTRVDGCLGKIQNSAFLKSADSYGFNRSNALLFAGVAMGATLLTKYPEYTAIPLMGAFTLSGNVQAFHLALKIAAFSVVAIATFNYITDDTPSPYIP